MRRAAREETAEYMACPGVGGRKCGAYLVTTTEGMLYQLHDRAGQAIDLFEKLEKGAAFMDDAVCAVTSLGQCPRCEAQICFNCKCVLLAFLWLGR